MACSHDATCGKGICGATNVARPVQFTRCATCGKQKSEATWSLFSRGQGSKGWEKNMFFLFFCFLFFFWGGGNVFPRFFHPPKNQGHGNFGNFHFFFMEAQKQLICAC